MKDKKNISNFSVPNNYFATIKKRVFLKIAEEKLPKTTGFGIPDEYFDTIEPRIAKRIANETQPKVRRMISTRVYAYVASVAACLVLVFSLVKSSHAPTDIESVNLSAIDQYIEAGNLDIDLYELINYLSDFDEFDLNVETSLLTDSAIEEYLYMNLDDQFWVENYFDTP